MRIYLLRHAHALDLEDRGDRLALSDPQRYLSDKGRRTMRQVGRALREQQVRFDAVLTSPLVRAVQTAELLAEATDYLGLVEVLPALAPGVPPRIAAAELPQKGEAVAVVGHEPGLANLGAFLLGGPSFPPFRPGQVACLEDGRPLWYLHPESLAVERLLVA